MQEYVDYGEPDYSRPKTVSDSLNVSSPTITTKIKKQILYLNDELYKLKEQTLAIDDRWFGPSPKGIGAADSESPSDPGEFGELLMLLKIAQKGVDDIKQNLSRISNC
jgi:hypothetical protein